MIDELKGLESNLEGKLFYDALWRRIFATDASVYRTVPLAVAYPKTVEDLKKLISFATKNNTSLIPRTAGTSLAGQCVGEGIVVDVSKYFTGIIELNTGKRTIKVQPGVIRDDLNRYLKSHNLFFGPNTSTSNRCMIGGMVGNNSSGTTSIKYGVTRDKVLEMKVLLSDGSEAVFSEITSEEFREKMQVDSMEGDIYRKLYQELKPEDVRQQIISGFPKPEIHRRNTGYAVDELISAEVLGGKEGKINICKLLCGSEGTLAFTTEITLQLDELPPKDAVMIAAHFDSVEKCLQAVVPAMRHSLFTCEMMDKVILDCTKNSIKYRENRFFIEGDPAAILMLEIRSASEEELTDRTADLLKTLADSNLAYALPVLRNETIELALELRKAGLGLLGNIVGDRKAVACIEDTAVAVEDLAAYISEFSDLMKDYGQEAVYYAHAGAGELHLRPILNLKKEADVALFRKITEDVASLVKKHGGSMSGEHGDGRVRAEFIEFMIGEGNYNLLKRVKNIFVPLMSWQAVFNPEVVFSRQAWEAFLLGADLPEMSRRSLVVWDLRLPRVFVAILVGMNLAVSGAIFQAVTRNELASPFILGVSSGAGFAILVTLVVFTGLSALLPLVAAVGGAVAFLVVYLIAWQSGTSPVRLVLAGVIVGTVFQAGQTALFFFAQDIAVVQSAIQWTTGSLTAVDWDQVRIILPWSVLAIALAVLSARQLNVLLLGERTAKSLGMSVERVRFGVSAIAVLAAAASIAAAGIVGFVGLIVPHMVRQFVGSDYKQLIIGCVFAGPALMVVADVGARVGFQFVTGSMGQMPVGILTGLIGGPYFLYLMRKQGNIGEF